MEQRDAAVDLHDFAVAVTVKDPNGKGSPLTAGCVLRGSVSVTAPASSSSSDVGGAVWRLRALRVQAEGMEQHRISKARLRVASALSPLSRASAASSKAIEEVCSPTIHLWRTLTLVGVPSAGEVEAAQAQVASERVFAQTNSRGAPLTGVVLSVRGNNDNDHDHDHGGEGGGGDSSLRANGRGGDGIDTIDYEVGSPRSVLFMRPGDTVSVPFALRLPPWLPPSLYYHLDSTAQGFIRYHLTAILEADLLPADGGGDGGGGGDIVAAAAAALATGRTPLRRGEWRSTATPFVLRSAFPRRQLLQGCERAGIKPIFSQTWRFRVRSRNPFWQILNSGNVTIGAIEVVVKYLSSTALLLTDPDDRCSVDMTERWTKVLLGGTSSPNSPPLPSALEPSHMDGVTALGTVVGGGGSTAGSARTPDGANALSPPSSLAGVSDGGGGGGDTRTPRGQPPRAPVGELRLRVRVHNGNPNDSKKALRRLPDIDCVRVELVEQVLLHTAPPAPKAERPSELDNTGVVYCSEPVRLGYQDYTQKIKPGSAQSFEVVIPLPPRFRRAKDISTSTVRKAKESESGRARGQDGGGGDDDDAGYRSPDVDSGLANDVNVTEGGDALGVAYPWQRRPPPPSSVTTRHFTSLTYLRVSLPSVDVIPEIEPQARNVILLAEAVDGADATPYLPMITST